MAQIRETRYLCDSCGKQVDKPKDLRTFQIVPKVSSGYDYNQAVKTELCDPCEEKLIHAIEDFVKDEDYATVQAYRRPQPGT